METNTSSSFEDLLQHDQGTNAEDEVTRLSRKNDQEKGTDEFDLMTSFAPSPLALWLSIALY